MLLDSVLSLGFRCLARGSGGFEQVIEIKQVSLVQLLGEAIERDARLVAALDTQPA